MNDLTKYADQKGLRVDLTPSTSFGGTSVPRLTNFYKKFGFVSNSGKNKDYSISDTMYRLPETKRNNPYRDSDGRFGSGPGGGNGLNHKQVYDLQAGESDTQVRQVYAAEEKLNPQVTNKSEPPRGPSGEMLKKGEITQAQYDKEYKEYSKAHGVWARESSKSIQSELGAKHLNGTPKGTQAYVDEVTKSDWFVAEFGDGGPIGTPKVAHKASNRFAGRYYVSTKDGGISGLDVEKSMVLHEPTIIHELSHYATTISETKPFAGHGANFTKNHIFIASKIAGADYAEGLKKAYEEGGVKVG